MAASYVHGASDVALLGETIGTCLDRISAAHGDCDALVSCYQRVRYTYRELHAEVERYARGLLALGVERGDRVGIWGPNSAEWLVTQYATAKIGAILVNINPAYRLRELDYALNQSGVATLVMSPRFRATDYVAMLSELAPELAARRRELASARLPDLRTVVCLGGECLPGMISWQQLGASGDEVPVGRLGEREAALHFDDAINIQYTSGTTGAPKGATLSHHNILNNGFFIGERLRYSSADRICLPVPFYHCFGCVLGNLAALTHASAIVLPAESFEAESCLRAVQDERCTSLYGVPTMFIAELEHPAFSRYELSSLRTGIMAGAPCPVEIMRQVIGRMHMPEVTICYGMTETSPVSFQTASDDRLEHRVSTVGRIHPHVECKIVDPETGIVVPRGRSGELCTRGYCVMLGYWGDPDATAAAIDPARWMHTGDLAVMRDDGYVNIVGRLKDMIIRGGENVYPREIEEFLHTHPMVSDVQVIGVPDAKYGEEVCAWIRLREGHAVTAEEIREYCRGQIATYKIPRYVRFTTEFPMTVTGKVQKFRMRELTIAELGLGSVDRIKTA
ncbi:MAG TPA: AMP-binding protein [Vicinamibacterales bacterium]|jgi:fatty-acyl-CoA synthase|nr:AMP-binding protein [Vicinamibacterales bacterium]